jgi:hypothetical protein
MDLASIKLPTEQEVQDYLALVNEYNDAEAGEEPEQAD